jgi:hypothetical protein
LRGGPICGALRLGGHAIAQLRDAPLQPRYGRRVFVRFLHHPQDALALGEIPGAGALFDVQHRVGEQVHQGVLGANLHRLLFEDAQVHFECALTGGNEELALLHRLVGALQELIDRQRVDHRRLDHHRFAAGFVRGHRRGSRCGRLRCWRRRRRCLFSSAAGAQ